MKNQFRNFLFIPLYLFSIQSMAQKATMNPGILPLTSDGRTSIRGLSVPDDKTVWISGSSGKVARSIDAGVTWQWMTVAGYEKKDFRDIEAFDGNTAIIMAVDAPAIILKTKDAGKNWYKVFEYTTKGMFLDAMDFSDDKNGVVIGDPINNKLFIAFTKDGGETWEKREKYSAIDMNKGEAFFASSGTNIKLWQDKKLSVPVFVSGGTRSRLLPAELNDTIAIVQGKESTGANSIDVFKGKAVIVGGDFAKDGDSRDNCLLVTLGKKPQFSKPQTPPHGYRSCVIYLNGKQLLTCGTSGVDISGDGGNNWELVSKDSYHVCKKSKKGSAVYLAGSRGKIARLEWEVLATPDH